MASRDLAGCPLVAAFAEAQRAINEHIARTKRIAFSPTNSLRRRGPPQAIQRKDANRLDFIPPKVDRKTASPMECFQVHVIKVEVKVFVGQRIDGIPSVIGQRETMTRSIEIPDRHLNGKVRAYPDENVSDHDPVVSNRVIWESCCDGSVPF